MDRLQRTRSQHFVSSPRKTASPLIARHTLYHRHPPKKRRLGVTTFVASHNEAGQGYTNELEDDLEKAIMKRGESSSAPAGRTSRSRSQSRPVRQKVTTRFRPTRYQTDRTMKMSLAQKAKTVKSRVIIN